MYTSAIVFLALTFAAGGYGAYILTGSLVSRFTGLQKTVRTSVSAGAAALLVVLTGTLGILALDRAQYAAYNTGADRGYADGYAKAVSAPDPRQDEPAEPASADISDSAYLEGYIRGYGDGFKGAAFIYSGVRAAIESGGEVVEIVLPDGIEVPDGLELPANVSVGGSGSGGSGDSPAEKEEEPAKDPTGVTVYYTRSGSVIHYDKNCSYLRNASQILSCDLADAPSRPPCSRCGR